MKQRSRSGGSGRLPGVTEPGSSYADREPREPHILHTNGSGSSSLRSWEGIFALLPGGANTSSRAKHTGWEGNPVIRMCKTHKY